MRSERRQGSEHPPDGVLYDLTDLARSQVSVSPAGRATMTAALAAPADDSV
ncbi:MULTISPECIES: hypothetical protein [Sorangium]|uniref:Uncharacterized protein n=1 Tax=Sorangium cellulosum TaxID=56 RepID=A0A4P2QMI0_SORCE|nr:MULTISPECIES: hypothetical protein [Sorangium]AUX30723.1 uncharacterized protein SOCE836_028340 [Sorangium cellulosum]WCQ90110.1 hypothetical protein NQZ70_02811 [Sorangium sp. Soce836]